MLGQLPTSLNIAGKTYAIRSDYRNVLRIIAAYNATDLNDREKVLVCLKRLYTDFSSIPQTELATAYEEAIAFIECHMKSDKPSPKVVDWSKDEQLIFSAVNKVAGCEVRSVEYMHWWTFLGYFQSVDRDDLWGAVLTIRQKKAKRQKLEKYETEFYNANRSMCDLEAPVDRKQAALDYADALYQELLSRKE